MNNQIENNWIGLDSSGALDRGNAKNGINLSQADGNIIKNNVVSGNDNDGIQINGAQAHSNLVINNIIGLDPSEDFAIGNTFSGVALIDACVRLIPGVMGKEASGTEESFSEGLLEYPHYTRPALFEGQAIPEILTGGDHGKVRAWRRAEAERLTQARRPDLWAAYQNRPKNPK